MLVHTCEKVLCDYEKSDTLCLTINQHSTTSYTSIYINSIKLSFNNFMQRTAYVQPRIKSMAQSISNKAL